MKQSFTIPGRLPSLNDYTAANRTNPHVGAEMKRTAEDGIAWEIRAAKVLPVAGPVHVAIHWHERNSRRDPDNVFFACKFLLDAMVRLGIIPNDDQAHIASIAHTIHVDRENPRVVVTLEEAS